MEGSAAPNVAGTIAGLFGLVALVVGICSRRSASAIKWGAIIGMNIILPTFLAAFQANAMAASNQVDLTVTLATGGTFSPAVLTTIANTEGVQVATGMLSRPVNLPVDSRPDRLLVRAQLHVAGQADQRLTDQGLGPGVGDRPQR